MTRAASEPNAGFRAARTISGACAVLAALIGALALAGWAFGLPALADTVHGLPATNPLTAICILLASASLWTLGRRTQGRGAAAFTQACAGLAAGLASLRLLGLGLDIAPDLDLYLFRGQLAASPVPSRMGVQASLALACVGLALVLLDTRIRRRRVSDALVFAGLGTSLVALVGYAYQAGAMHGLMAINTACATTLLCVGALLARPERGLCALLLRPSAGGVMARRLLPAATIVTLVLAWLRLEGQRAGWFGLAIGTAMLAIAIVAMLVGLIWDTGRRLDTAEREQRRAEDALRQNLDRQARMLEANFIGVLTARTDGWITDANPAFLHMIGYERGELPIRSEAITPPEWMSRTDTAVREITTVGVATPFEKEYLNKNGRRVPVLVGAAAMPGTDGEVMAFVVDLSGKKGAERAMERMRLFLDSVIENLPDMVFVKEAKDLRFVQFNRAGETLLGMRREELIGKNDYDFFPREQAEFFVEKDRQVLAGREMLDIPEEEIRTRNGETRVLHTKKVPILDREGTPQYLLGISEDITDRKRAERERSALNEGLRQRTAQLEVANRELEAFSYSVSHDLRAPLRHIDGFTDLLIRHAGPTLDEKGRRQLDTISQSAKSMGRLIDDLLAFSRMSRTEMKRGPVELDALVTDTRRALEGDAAGRTVRWSVAPLPTVEADRGMLRLVFDNLLSNALKYSRPRPEAVIEVGSQETADEVIVFVRDNGVGFDMKYAHKLFGVFQRLHSDDEFEGTGIGLANVRRIIQRHGGRAWAEGEVGAGATFYVALPRTPVVEESKEAA